MKRLKIPHGTPVLIGAPAKPMPAALSEAIGRMVSEKKGIVEAHLPQCFVLNFMEKPAQVLVLVVHGRDSLESVLDSLSREIRSILPTEHHLDVWPMEEGDALLSAVRGARCKIFGTTSSGNFSTTKS